MDYVIYVGDTETTGLDSRLNDVIELSLYRLTDGEQKTWCLRPTNSDNIDPGALRMNGHKLEDITCRTKEGRERYLDPDKVIIEVENWLAQDGVPTENRVLCGQNIAFDRDMLLQLWTKCNSKDSFPFGRRVMDTMIWAFMMDYAKQDFAEGYSLNNLIKKYAIKNEKAHTAAADVRATKDLFLAQVNELRNKLNIK